MPIDFPNSPSDNDVYTVGNRSWVYSASLGTWTLQSSALLGANTVTATELATNAVTSTKILDGTIATGDIADLAITSAKTSNLTVDTKTENYTLVAGDRGKRIVANKSTAITFTVPNSVFSAGDTLEVHNINTGVLTIAAGAGVTLNGADVLTVAQWQGGTLYFTSASSSIWFPSTPKRMVIQVVEGTTNTQTTNSTTTYADTGLSATITPTSSTSKILCLISHPMVLKTNGNAQNGLVMRLVRGSTNLEEFALYQLYTGTALEITGQSNAVILDSPATTSSTTYKTQFRNVVAAASVQVQQQSITSRLVLMEIAV